MLVRLPSASYSYVNVTVGRSGEPTSAWLVSSPSALYVYWYALLSSLTAVSSPSALYCNRRRRAACRRRG